MLDYFLQVLNTLVENDQALYTIFVTLAAITVMALCLGAGIFVLGAIDPLRARLRWLAGDQPKKSNSKLEELSRAIEPVSNYVLPVKQKERGRVSQQLSRAGFRSSNALTSFYAIKTLLATIFPLLALAGTRIVPDLTSTTIMFVVALASFIGLMLPNFVINHLCSKRIKNLRHGFPDALDLLVVCVESGLGLTAALQRVANELTVSYPELARELDLVNVEIRAGVSRVDALKGLADRTGLDDIKGLVSLLIQSMKFGTSVAETLRVYSDEFRDRRMQLAEEKAAKMGTLLIFPLVFCMFPAFFIVAIGPAVLRFMTVFSGN